MNQPDWTAQINDLLSEISKYDEAQAEQERVEDNEREK